MKVAAIREKLGQIPGALIDIPPGTGTSGNEAGVVGSTLNDPDWSSKELDSPGLRWSSEDGDPLAPTELDNFDPVFEWGAQSDDSLRRLGDAADEEIRKSVELRSGPDALGHYASFHIRGGQWGATVKTSGIAWLARSYFQTLPVDELTRARLAFHAILQHELFHFAADIAVTHAELSQRQAWWRPAGEARMARGESYSHREEMLANVWMLRAFRTALPGYRVSGKQAALKSFVRRQPPGYRDALRFDANRWTPELQNLVYEYAENSGHVEDNPLLWGWGFDWPNVFPVWPRIDWRDCAIHLVDDSARFGVPPGWLTFLSALSAIEESPKFQKQLTALGNRQRESWERAKRRATESLTAGHDFKPWPKGGKDVWSMRVDQSFRVHLLRDRATDRWLALEIGSHKAMGHG